jgi:predicted protein tyrosine phosphatase
LALQIPELNLELRIASREEAQRLTQLDPNRWCVISIHGRDETPARLPKAKAVALLVFDDLLTDVSDSGGPGPRAIHARQILEAAERFLGQPLLIHCAMGISRSAATALGILYWQARRQGLANPVDRTFAWLERLGTFRPNARLARLLIEAIDADQDKPFETFRRHPKWHLKSSGDFYDKFYPKPSRPKQ